MGVLVFSFLIPVNYLHGSSQSSPAGGTTEKEAGARAGEEPSVTDYGELECNTWGVSGNISEVLTTSFPSVRPSFRSVSAQISLEAHGE